MRGVNKGGIPPQQVIHPVAQSNSMPFHLLGTNKRRRGFGEEELEKKLPDNLEKVVPESILYSRLVDFERNVDTTMYHRLLDIYEFLRPKPTRAPSVLRLCISNTHNNQGAHYHVDDSSVHSAEHKPCWTMRIEGRIVTSQTGHSQWPSLPRKFTSFFKRIFVQLDPKEFPGNDTVEWARTLNTVDSDCFEVKRPGREDTKVKIVFELSHQPTQFKLSPNLANILHAPMLSRSRVIMSLWHYIKVNKLQDPQDRKMFTNNAQLKEIFGTEKTAFAQIPHLVLSHLSPPDPIEVEFTVKCGATQEESEQTFDINIFLEENTEEMQNVRDYFKKVGAFDEQIDAIVNEIHNKKQRMDFMMGFAESPVPFINKLVASQIHDLKLLSSSTETDEEQLRTAEFYFQPWMKDAIHSILDNTTVPQQERLNMDDFTVKDEGHN